MIYLDNNATTQLDRNVAAVMLEVWQSGPLNASSQHAMGRRARNLLDDAVSELGRLLGADVDSPGGDSLVLTSGGTEANNWALRGIGDPLAPLVISAIEHPSVLEVARQQAAAGRQVRVIPVGLAGVIDLETAGRLIADSSPRPALVSVMAANNETGVIQPIEALAKLCHAAGVPLHVDATQAVGKLAIDFRQTGVAAMTAAGHKFHGPAGIGLLVVRSGLAIRPLIQGGQQQLDKRSGTEAVALAVGMAHALRIAEQGRESFAARMQSLRDRLETLLVGELPQVVIHGSGTERLPGTTCVSFPTIDRQAMLMALDLAGICCSSGSACASGSSQPSHVLQAMGVPESQIASALRFGFSRLSTPADCDQAAIAILRCYRRLSDKKAVEKSL